MDPKRNATDRARRISEGSLVSLILAQLQQLDGVWAWRSNTGAAQTRSGRVVRFGTPGQADISGILRGGRRLEIEVKSSTGRLTPEQTAFAKRITELGGLHLVARTLAEAMVPVMQALGTLPGDPP